MIVKAPANWSIKYLEHGFAAIEVEMVDIRTFGGNTALSGRFLFFTTAEVADALRAPGRGLSIEVQVHVPGLAD